jgi:serine/threonine-protein kinase
MGAHAAASLTPRRSSESSGHSSSSSFQAGGFAPGAVLAERYRIIALLGRGGMGEVYRADDLNLGHPVALKFLRRSLAQDPALLERFRAEVRNARQVSHPNVCRVYDIGELDSQHFLSMEYVDGEDLAMLLKRIGRLPAAKALEIARQLCAGLAAAHDKGVLHRDLKPSNIMLDGHGRVRITDFGLAVQADGAGAEAGLAGTPAYMSPEQTEGRPATARSDLYALGLVLYEVFTGKKVFEATSFAEWRRAHTQEQPTSPSVHVTDVEAAVERAILRCLEKDPAKRPASALQLAASLPGGDPLAAALAAGETPSPELVAASGESAGLRAGVAWAVLLSTLAIIGLLAWLNGKAMLISRVRPENPPEVMAARAREIIERISYSKPPVDTVFGYRTGYEYLDAVRKRDKSPDRWDRLGPQAIEFWYRQSPFSLLPQRPLSFFTSYGGLTGNPPFEIPGEVSLLFDARGKLLELLAIPPEDDDSPDPGVPPNWNTIFTEAGLEMTQFKSATPRWTPRHYADTRAAWERTSASPPDIERIEAGAYRGKIVFFRVLATGTKPLDLAVEFWLELAFVIFWLVLVLVGGVWFALRNLRLGRGDRRGANRLAACALVGGVLVHIAGVRHSATFMELLFFLSALTFMLLVAGATWVLYIALEPFVRRRSPHLLISWTRLLSGAFRDPLLGRDIAIGCLVGTVLVLLVHAERVAPLWAGLPAGDPLSSSFLLRSQSAPFLHPLRPLFGSIVFTLATLFALTFFRVVLRKQWAAVGLLLALAVAPSAFAEAPLLAVFFALLGWGIHLAALSRWGISAFLAALWTYRMLREYPFTLDFSAWYAGIGLSGVALVVAVALFGFYTALGGKPIFGGASLEE